MPGLQVIGIPAIMRAAPCNDSNNPCKFQSNSERKDGASDGGGEGYLLCFLVPVVFLGVCFVCFLNLGIPQAVETLSFLLREETSPSTQAGRYC